MCFVKRIKGGCIMAKLRNTIRNKKTITVKLKQNPKEDDQFGSGNLGIQTPTGSTSKPKEILPDIMNIEKEVLQSIVGQDIAVKQIITAIYRSINFKTIKSNVLIIGNSGTGKTETIKQIAKRLNIPYTIIEGTTIKVPLTFNLYDERLVDFNTKNITIIFLGAFSGLDMIRDKRLNSNPLGFSIKDETQKVKAKFLKQDLVKYGMPEEFVGRIDTIVEMNKLTKEDLALILKKSELSIFKKYQNELSNIGITLSYNDDLFESIAEKSLVLDTGARELSNTVNYMFENIVFDVLSNPNKYKKCILDTEIAQNNTKYTLS